MEEEKYKLYQEEQFRRYEERCKHCGKCCGSQDGDPCANLVTGNNGEYLCRVYENRLGQQKTKSGKIFYCVPIKQVISYAGARPGCAYAE